MRLLSYYVKKFSKFFNIKTQGQTAIIVILVVMSVAIVIIGGVSTLVVNEAKTSRLQIQSFEAIYASEGGVEDALYRIIKGKQIDNSETLAIGNAVATVTITDTEVESTIHSEGVRDASHRSIEIILDKVFTAANFYYGVQIGDGGLVMGNNAAVVGNVYSNGNIIGTNGAVITSDAIVASGITSTPTFEWLTNNVDHAFATSSSNRDIAQSFNATASGLLNRIAVMIAKAGGPSQDITVHIVSDDSGSPDTDDLASAEISPSQVGAGAVWLNIAFESPATVVSGTKYWIVLDYDSDSAVNYWIWRKDSSDAYSSNTGKYKNNWTSGGSWSDASGDFAFKVWVGGINRKIDNVVVGAATVGTGRANLFVDANIHGSDCPNQYCIVEDAISQAFPIPQSDIDSWKSEAVSGGVCGLADGCDAGGNYKLDGGATGSLGPKKITGNLELDNNSTLTVTGTLYVAGNIVLSNNCNVALVSSYGNFSGIIITDGTVAISNNCAFSGSGDPDSYVMLMSEKDAPSDEVITVDNNSAGVIYYADSGRIKFSNNATAKEATAYGMTLDNNTVITYESGLADLRFSSGPSGGYSIGIWEEVP